MPRLRFLYNRNDPAQGLWARPLHGVSPWSVERQDLYPAGHSAFILDCDRCDVVPAPFKYPPNFDPAFNDDKKHQVIRVPPYLCTPYLRGIGAVRKQGPESVRHLLERSGSLKRHR